MEENRDILQLMQKIERNTRRQTFFCGVLCVLVLLTLLCFAFIGITVARVLPLVTEVIPEINGVISQMQTVLDNLETTTTQLAQVDLSGMVDDLNNLVETVRGSLETTMEKLNSMDFDSLNKAIKDLAALTGPLTKVASLFR